MTKLYHQTLARMEQSLTCALISSPIDQKHGVFAVDADDTVILEYALPNRFEHIPLASTGESRTPTISHLAEVDLDKQTVRMRRPIALIDVVAGDTPISRAAELLALRPFYLVLEQTCITRVLTVSDLNLLPVRTHLHMVLDHLESLMAASIESASPRDGWLGSLGPDKQKAVRELYEQKKQDDFDTRLVDCTTLSDKATVIGKMKVLTLRLGCSSRTQFNGEYDEICRLRNRLAHRLPPLNEETDELRDNLEHGQPISKKKDVKWLARTTATINAWIKVLSFEEQSCMDPKGVRRTREGHSPDSTRSELNPTRPD